MLNPFRLYDSNSRRMMLPNEAVRLGIFVAPEGYAVQYKDHRFIRLEHVHVMHKTGWKDVNKTEVWEGDAVECDVMLNLGGVVSCVKSRGAVEWDKRKGHFFVQVEKTPLVDGKVQIGQIRVIGDVYQKRNEVLQT